MNAVYFDSSLPEKEAKSRYKIPENLMMENAALALEKTVHLINQTNPISKILILCGKGNNGGDGLALARRLNGIYEMDTVLLGEPKTQESITQYEMAKAIGVSFIESKNISWKQYNLIVDCIYGTGFHGEFSPDISDLLENANKSKAIRLACDVPSGISKNGSCCKNSFNAHYTVTMGAYKTCLLSDEAKQLSGKISVASLGISSKNFEKCFSPDAYIIEEVDINLPVRKNKSAHKGTFGHTVVYAGEKSGAAILSASSALEFGSGLSTLLKTTNSNLNQFKISPSLMISDSIPAKTTCIVIGNGLGNPDQKDIEDFEKWFSTVNKPACVIDADLFNYENFETLISKLNTVPNARIVLTPHPKEFQTLVNKLKINNKSDYSISEVALNRISLGKIICEKYPQLTLVLKSSNTFIVQQGQTYICNNGSPALAKAGSGDVLAGMIGSLLAQGYSAKDAAITACYVHGKASCQFEEKNYSMTAEKLIEKL